MFERASTMTVVQKNKINNMFYRELCVIPVSFAVKRDTKGNDLKKRLDANIQKLNQQNIFGKYYKYTKLPKSGVVSLDE